MPIEIAFPFALDDSGQVAVESNPDAQIRNHVLALVNTARSERVVLGDYGIPLVQELFENDPTVVSNEVASLIRAAFAKWEPGITLVSVSATPQDTGVNVSVNYQRQDAPETGLGGSKINTAVITVGGHVAEVVRA